MKTLVYIILGIALIAGGCKKKKQQEAAEAARPAPEVAVARPEVSDVIYTYQYPAYLEAVQTVNLVARVSGFLEKMNYIPGVPVKKGDLLFVIEPQPYLDQVKAAQAELKSTQARLAYAKAQYEKMKEAMPSKAVSEIDFIQSESDYHTAIANQQNAKAQLNTARTNLNYCYIKAPFDGRVTRNMVDVQNFVGGAAQPVTLATMYRDKVMFAYFNMAYAEFQNLPVIGNPTSPADTVMQLSITDASDSTRVWHGRLDYSSPNVDLQTGTVTVRAIADNPKQELLSGMYVKITIPYKQVYHAVQIPETSIGTSQAGRFVYLVNDDDEIVQQTVKVGILSPNGMREILSGATPDDLYVVQAMMTVRPGMKVKPIARKRRTSLRSE